MRKSTLIRAAAWGIVAAGVAAPLVRRRVGLKPVVVTAVSGAAPFALCVARPRTPVRDVATCCLQMWAYVATYQMPHDDPDALEARVYIDYPVRADRILGLGELPTLRLQRLMARPDTIDGKDKVLIWAHWLWFLIPHSSLVYILLRRRDRFPRAAVLIYGTFDLGAGIYWLVPTAPPWFADEKGRIDQPEGRRLRRMMYEYGEQFWKDGWRPLYSFLGGNPLAAMPSLHFATSLMAATVLADVGVVEGTVGWAYTLTLGLALVYLGEHYLVDLIAGAALYEGVRRYGPTAAPLLRAVSQGIQSLEAKAHA